jgi:hypothetical protein
MFTVVAFDIETLGLLHEVPLPEITCVCLYSGPHDPEGDEQLRLWRLPPEERIINVTRIIQRLDAADVIAGFNAVLFDLEFLRRALHIDDDRALRWVLKCVDPYMVARFIVGESCGMNYMLSLNGLEGKTGSGKEAIAMAQNDEWPALLSYCRMDAKLTYDLCAMEWLRLTPGLECRLDWGRAPPVFRFASMNTATHPPPPPPLPFGSSAHEMEWVCADGEELPCWCD